MVTSVPSLRKTLNERFVLFQVKTCGDVNIFFRGKNSSVYDVRFGENKGLMSRIWFDSLGGSQSSTHYTSIIDCDSYQDFWITWNDDTIKVGKGGLKGTHMFLMYIPGFVIPTIDTVEIQSHISLANWTFQIEKVCRYFMHNTFVSV